MHGRHRSAAAGRAFREIVGPQQARLAGDVGQGLALVPDVIAGGDAINARFIKVVANLRRHAKTMRCVFGIHDHGIDFVFTADIGKLRCHRITRIAAHNIAQEKYSHSLCFLVIKPSIA